MDKTNRYQKMWNIIEKVTLKIPRKPINDFLDKIFTIYEKGNNH